MERYSDLYGRENTVPDTTLEAVEYLPVVEKLDETTILEDFTKAIGKAPGLDGVPVEVIKSAKGPLLEDLNALLCHSWVEGFVPQDMRDCNILTLYKNKGDRNNYRGSHC